MSWQRQDRSSRSAASGFSVVIGVMLLTGVGGRAAAEANLTPAAFIPQWLPQAQFAGYYVADRKGFYRDRGIDVTVLTGGPDRPAAAALASGDADFASLWLTTAVRLIDRGVGVVDVAQLLQRSGLVIVAKQSTGIRTPSDLNGKRLAVWQGDLRIEPEAFVRRFGLSVQMVPVGSSLSLFLRNGVDATTAMLYNEYHTLLNAGLDPEELTTLTLADHGMDLPEDGIYCLAATRRQSPALVAAFVGASLDGWQDAFAHPDEALDIVLHVMREAHVPANRMHQRWMLARMRDLINPPADSGRPTGVLSRSTYDAAVQILEEQGWVRDAPELGDFYRPVTE